MAGPADGEQDGAVPVPCGGDGGAGPRVPTPCTTALPYHGRRLHGTIDYILCRCIDIYTEVEGQYRHVYSSPPGLGRWTHLCVCFWCVGGDLEAAAVVGCVPAGGRTGGHRRGGRRRKTGDLQGTSSENQCVQREEGRFVYFYALLQIHTSPLQSMWSDVIMVCVHSYILTHPLTSSRLLSPPPPFHPPLVC
jgi:hypothetical protein